MSRLKFRNFGGFDGKGRKRKAYVHWNSEGEEGEGEGGRFWERKADRIRLFFLFSISLVDEMMAN